MSAEWRTRPQYVVRSYWETGSWRLPGIEADMAVETKGTAHKGPRTGEREVNLFFCGEHAFSIARAVRPISR